MITPKLEELILTGKAVYKKYTHAFGMFGSIPIPKDKIVIITDIKWNQFINPYLNSPDISVADFLNYNEYQMRIDGNRSNNFLTYRNIISLNPVDFSFAGSLDEPIAGFEDLFHFTTGDPIIQDVFFICDEHINITISRNAYRNSFSCNYSLLNQVSAQQNMPNGVQDLNVLLDMEMSSLADAQWYSPPTYKNAGQSPNDRSKEGYAQDICDESQIYDPDTGFNATLDRPYLTSPLVEFGCVIINSNSFNNLMQS